MKIKALDMVLLGWFIMGAWGFTWGLQDGLIMLSLCFIFAGISIAVAKAWRREFGWYDDDQG